MSDEFKISLGIELDSNASNSLNTKISNLKISPIKIQIDNDIFNQINKIQQAIQALGNTTINLNINSSGGNKGIKNTTSALQKAIRDVANLYKQIKDAELKVGKFGLSGLNSDEITKYHQKLNSLRNTYNQLLNNLNSDDIELDVIFTEVDLSRTAIAELLSEIDNARAKSASEIKIKVNRGDLLKQIDALENNFNNLNVASDNVTNNILELRNLLNTIDSADNVEFITAKYREFEQVLKSTTNQVSELQYQQKLTDDSEAFKNEKDIFDLDMRVWKKENSAAVRVFGDEIDSLIAKLKTADRVEFKQIKSEFDTIKKKAALAGKATLSTWDKIKNKIKEHGVYLSASFLFGQATNAIRSMFNEVVKIDSAMTELKKVTDETNEAYQSFLLNSAKRAKELGVTIDGLVESTADFARLGYGFEESQELAEIANIYAVVGDEIDSVETATQSLISTMTAFGNEVTAMEIIDKFNEIGNKFAITSGGIGDALQRSASSMSAAGNSLDETIALITAANTVVQDADSVGTAFKTISMRIRGAKTDLADAGLEIDGMADSTAELRKEIMALSGVDIMLDENTFKSTYQILDELAQKWDTLTDIQQASITELIAGKRQGNIISSLMDNFDIAREAVEVSLNSEGSAMAEHEKWMESLEAKLLELQAAWQSLSETFLKSELLSTGIEFITKFVEGLDWIVQHLGTIGTISAGLALFNTSKNVLSSMKSSLDETGRSFSNLSTAAKMAGTNLKAFIKTPAGIASAVGLAITAISTLIQIQKNWEEKQARQRRETIDANNAILDSVDSFDQVYLKYADRTHLTSEEEDELKNAIYNTIDALGEKGGVIRDLIGDNNDYIASIENVSKALLEEAKIAANNARVAAQQELQSATWDAITGSQITIGLGTNKSDEDNKVREIIESYMGDYIDQEIQNVGHGTSVIEYEIEPLNWDSAHSFDDMENVVSYYYNLIAAMKELEKQAENTGDDTYITNGFYKEAKDVAGELSEIVEQYVSSQYEWIKQDYQIENGLIRNIEQYQQMRNTILENTEYSQELKDALISIADIEYGKIFDLSEYNDKENIISNIAQLFAGSDDIKNSHFRYVEQELDNFNAWLKGLSSEELSIVYDISLNNSDEARKNMLAQLEKLGKGGNVDLTIRPVIDAQELIAAGWKDAGEGAATVFTSTFSNKAAELNQEDGIAMNFTPIIVDENGNYARVLSPEELEEYALNVINGVHEDDLNLKIGATYNGSDAISQAEADAIKIHELHEKYLLTSPISEWKMEDWQNALENYQIPESAKFSFSELISGEGFTDKIDNHTQKIQTLKEALDSLKDGSFDESDFVELIKSFPELADNADNLEEAIQASIEDINLGTFEDLIGYLDYMESDADYVALQNLISALTDAEIEMHNALDFTEFLDNLNNVVDSFDGLVSSMSKLRDGTALTKGEIVDLISEYPKLLTQANLFTDGSIAGQQKMLDNILQVYEIEYNALIDTKIAELKATNEVLNAALENEKAKVQKVIEISGLETQTELEYRALLAEKLQEFNDLDGQNYVEYSNGVLSVNKEMLDGILEQGGQFGELSTENIWQPQAVVIGESFAKGGSAALESLNTLGSKVSTWVDGLKTRFKSLAKTIKAALSGEEYDDGEGTKEVDTTIEVDVDDVKFKGEGITIDEKTIKDWSDEQQEILQKRIEEIQKTIDTNNIAIDNLEKLKGLDLVDIYGDDSESSAKKFKESFGWIETAIDRLERAISSLDLKANSIYKNWINRNKALKDQIASVKSEIDLQQKAYYRYLQEANSIDLDAGYQELVKLGAIDIESIADEDLANKIKEFTEWYEKAMDCKDAIDELNESVSELYKQAFDNVVAEYDGILSVIEHEKNMLDEYINQSELQGYITSTKYYDALIANEETTIKKLQQEKSALLTALDNAIENGEIERYSEAWYGMVNEIDGVTLAIEEANSAVLEFQNSIREIEWSIFDLLQGHISNITKEADFLISLMDNDKLFDDRGQFTDIGMSTIGLHGMNSKVYMEQAKKYADEILDIDEQIAKNPYNQDLIERRQELLELQQDMILAYEDERDAIVDMVREGIEIELSALEELITTYTDALDSRKDLYDYNKKIAEQTKEIAQLEKQMTAYKGDDSEEVKSKVQQIKVSLEEAKDNLEETQYERYISDQTKLLDELYIEYEGILNARLDNIDALIADMIMDINTNSDMINATLVEQSEKVGYDLSEAMGNIWGNEGSFTTNITSAIDKIYEYLETMIKQLDAIAGKNVSKASTSSAAKKSSSGSSSSNNDAEIVAQMKANSEAWHNVTGATEEEKKAKQDALHEANMDLAEKLSYSTSYNDKTGKWSHYASGARRISTNKMAWTQEEGREYIVRPSDGAILTPLARNDSVLNATASNNIWDMANSPTEFIRDNLKLGEASAPIGQSGQTSITQNLDKVVFNLPNVKNYEELLTEMQRDKSFEKLILSMTIDRVAGKSALAKGKSLR